MAEELAYLDIECAVLRLRRWLGQTMAPVLGKGLLIGSLLLKGAGMGLLRKFNKNLSVRDLDDAGEGGAVRRRQGEPD